MAAAMADSLDKMRAMAAAGANVGDPANDRHALGHGRSRGRGRPAAARDCCHCSAAWPSLEPVAFDGVAAPADTHARASDGDACPLTMQRGDSKAPTREAPVDANRPFHHPRCRARALPGLGLRGGCRQSPLLESAAFGGRDALDFFLGSSDRAKIRVSGVPDVRSLVSLSSPGLVSGRNRKTGHWLHPSSCSRRTHGYGRRQTRRIQATRPDERWTLFVEQPAGRRLSPRRGRRCRTGPMVRPRVSAAALARIDGRHARERRETDTRREDRDP